MGRKHEAFTEEENRVLRAHLRKLRDEGGLSQAVLGQLLGSTQQNIARLLNVKAPGGMGRTTANALAHRLGFRDAEHLLLEAGVLATMKQPPTGAEWAERDLAAAVARSMRFSAQAIDNVVARYTDDAAKARAPKWWVMKFGDEERDLLIEEGARVVAELGRESEPGRKPKRRAR